ncbi:serine/threonine-protein kinase [Polyangium sp. 15x6]|uniref:serine/threonine-protein kinase n=1 Tax=Polyangium sp. 15x6 TaxID=3042687 RepID=UPI002499D6B6|nr:serine/threonine-protein kinase [Polyangium sp. 15x6]MDI3285281.1 serine/threonine-protein kinase [Polyangium sp. 15x6]
MTQQETLSPGMVLGRYELLLPIAQGGMATVWAARQKGSRGFQKTVAIKTMLPSLSDDPQFEQMFLDEASLAARIHHPNVAEILDVGEQDETIYIVMEWVDGEALSVITKTAKRSNVPVPQRIALRIVRQACAGLHAAHELRDDSDQLLNLVHRDVSPQNILVSYDGIVKLVDFGVAKALGRAGGETTAGQLKGKVPYMSPEQALGQKIDRRTDVFAMGIVLYRLTTGLHPFLGENDLATMKNIISRPLLPPRMKNPSFPVELERVLLTCLKKDPNERYQTMLELDAALERVLALSGASVVDDDIGAFTRSVMGDRGQKRRAELRDAVRAADERAAGIAMSPGAAQPHVHEAVSDIAITRMNSALTSFPTSMPRNSSTSIIPPSPESYAGGAMSGSLVPSTPPQKNTRAGLFMAVGAVAALSLAGTFMFLRTTMGPRAAAGNAAGNVAPTPPSPPAPTQAATPVAVQTGAAPESSASTGGGTVLDINDLPSADADPQATTKRDDKPAGTTKGTGATKPAATATAKPTGAPASTTWVPKVTDPGF